MQALAAIPSISNEAVQQRLDRVRTYYELLNLPFEVIHPALIFLLAVLLCLGSFQRLFVFPAGFVGLHHRTWGPVLSSRVSSRDKTWSILYQQEILEKFMMDLWFWQVFKSPKGQGPREGDPCWCRAESIWDIGPLTFLTYPLVRVHQRFQWFRMNEKGRDTFFFLGDWLPLQCLPPCNMILSSGFCFEDAIYIFSYLSGEFCTCKKGLVETSSYNWPVGTCMIFPFCWGVWFCIAHEAFYMFYSLLFFFCRSPSVLL